MVKNTTRNTVISQKIAKKTFLNKSLGLIGKKTPEAIIFHTRFGIYTFFLNFPIDVIILSKDQKVKALKNNLKPNRLFFWNIKFDTVIELPAGTIKQSKTQEGDILEVGL